MRQGHYARRTAPILERQLLAQVRARMVGRGIAELAAELGIDAARLSGWLAGSITPSRRWLGEMGARLDATMDGSHERGVGHVRTSTEAEKGSETKTPADHRPAGAGGGR